MSEKHESETSEQTWRSRHQRHDELPAHIKAESAGRVTTGHMVFVARGSGRMHGPDGDGIEDGEWRIDAWPAAPLNGPEAFLQLSYPWVDDIAESSTMDSLGGVALDLASCERLAEAAAHAAAVLRAGQWVPRPPGLAEVTAERDALAAHAERLTAALAREDLRDPLRARVEELEAERDALKRRVAELQRLVDNATAGPGDHI